jgi:hypothetical protein
MTRSTISFLLFLLAAAAMLCVSGCRLPSIQPPEDQSSSTTKDEEPPCEDCPGVPELNMLPGSVEWTAPVAHADPQVGDLLDCDQALSMAATCSRVINPADAADCYLSGWEEVFSQCPDGWRGEVPNFRPPTAEDDGDAIPEGRIVAWNNIFPNGAETARWYREEMGVSDAYFSSPQEAYLLGDDLQIGVRLFPQLTDLADETVEDGGRY